MSDSMVAALLRSEVPLAVVEAAAGCGKTYQGAEYARDAAAAASGGRVLILTHTHAACSVFKARTAAKSTNVEIKTIDALIAQIAGVYHQPLGLPSDVTSWVWRDGGKNFETLAGLVATFMAHQPMISSALAARYPIIVCDEHQDSSYHRHEIIMALHQGGAKLRIFGDPMQSIYGQRTDREARQDRARWASLCASGSYAKLEHPHRWNRGCADLGSWIMSARQKLERGEQIDLSGPLPPSVRVLRADNISQNPKGFQLSKEQRRPIDYVVKDSNQIMILASQNSLVEALRAFWGRTIPVWEGHTRDALVSLVASVRDHSGDAEALGRAMLDFVASTSKGFGAASHGKRLLQEIQDGCIKNTRAKPRNVQVIAKVILDDPSHRGVAIALQTVREFARSRAEGFEDVHIDRKTEFNDAIRLQDYASPDEGFVDLARRRTHVGALPPSKVLSSIHKAKGLECDHVMIAGCSDKHFSTTSYARSKLYVALSRPKHQLTFLMPSSSSSVLFRLL